MAKHRRSFYDRPLHERVGVKIFDGVLSMAAVYLLSPYLIQALAPIQAKINANAASSGATVSNVGTSALANQLLAAAGS